MIYEVTINNKKYEVEVEKGRAAVISTQTVAAPAAAPVQQTPVAAQAPAAAPVVNVGAGEPIKAPMPGTILDIKVSAGSTVKKGSVMFILEAMKMENEIVAPKDCTIVQVATSKGASVSTGDVLAIIQ